MQSYYALKFKNFQKFLTNKATEGFVVHIKKYLTSNEANQKLVFLPIFYLRFMYKKITKSIEKSREKFILSRKDYLLDTD